MPKILRMTDRVKFEVGGVTFIVAPLSTVQKSEISGATKTHGGETVIDLVKSQFLYIKYGLKGIEGIEDYDGKPYELEFENGSLTDQCVDELFNFSQKEDFINIAWQLFNGMPDKIIDPQTGKQMKGVKLEVVGKTKAES